MSSKENIRQGLKTGEYMTLEKPQSNATWWNNFNRIKDKDDNIINYVQCVRCKNLFAYEPKNTGSSTLKNHVSSCKIAPGSPTYSIENMLIKNNNIPLDVKRLVTDACAKMCSYDLRPYEMVSGRGFELLCQTLVDVGRKITTPIDASAIIPDPIIIK
jgi:hypothetical protein